MKSDRLIQSQVVMGQYRMFARLKQIGWGALFGTLIATQAFGQATLLPNAVQQFFTPSGIPAAGGTIDYFVPSTTTRKTTWDSSTESGGNQNPNPVLLNAGGFPQNGSSAITGVYGDGCYRQVVKDVNGNTIWDQPTCSTGSGGGGSGAFSEGVMVGAIIAWANPVLPAKYLYTAGQAISRTGFPDLFTAITFQQIILCSIGVSTITVPTNVSDKVPIGTPLEAACFAPGTTVISKSSGLLTMSSGATATTSVASTLFPWGNGNASTTFNVPDLRGRTLAGPDNMTGSIASRLTSTYYGVNPDAINAAGGNQSSSTTLLLTNLPPITPTGTISNGAISNVVSDGILGGTGTHGAANGGDFTAPSGSLGGDAIVVTSTQGASTFTGTGGGGSSTPFTFGVIQPTLTADYIIKALPDDLPSGPGVTSIQGMTGALSCGAGMTCTAQTISVTSALPLATADQYNCAASGALIQPSVVFQAETTTTFGATTTFDFCTFKSTAVTLTGNITTQTLANVVAGKAGTITFIQDASGGRTTVWNSIFKFTGGATPSLTATANAVDMLTYSCRSATFCAASLLTDVR